MKQYWIYTRLGSCPSAGYLLLSRHAGEHWTLLPLLPFPRAIHRNFPQDSRAPPRQAPCSPPMQTHPLTLLAWPRGTQGQESLQNPRPELSAVTLVYPARSCGVLRQHSACTAQYFPESASRATVRRAKPPHHLSSLPRSQEGSPARSLQSRAPGAPLSKGARSCRIVLHGLQTISP